MRKENSMIECTDLGKSYRKYVLFSDSTFGFRAQKVSFVMGPNGCGKTSLLKCLFGLEGFAGSIGFDGKDVSQVRKDCLVMWDGVFMYPNLSGLQNLLLFSDARKQTVRDAAETFLSGDVLKRKLKHYSTGQNKKLGLALVELCQPKYLAIDELSSGLDYESLVALKPVVQRWKQSMTLILTGHQFNFYNALVDDLYIFKDQKIELYAQDWRPEEGALEDVYDEEIIAKR
ncbi:MAG: ATP-binding cassette domain-containing protein [Coriobacteriales bacterium]|jgi:ABC-type multidrug transport system ATPase subunit|nr:ATP-binding cassette domain-containing protein [Coriobacteriales bacterium]